MEKPANLFKTNATKVQCSGVNQSKDRLRTVEKICKNTRPEVLHRTFVDIAVEKWKPDYN